MEVVSVGEDEEREEGEEKERVAKMAAVSPLYRGKHKSNKKCKVYRLKIIVMAQLWFFFAHFGTRKETQKKEEDSTNGRSVAGRL